MTQARTPQAPCIAADHRNMRHTGQAVPEGVAMHGACRSTRPARHCLSVPEPVTNQVTTPPSRARRSQTQPDKTIALTCRNTTRSDAIRRIRHAW